MRLYLFSRTQTNNQGSLRPKFTIRAKNPINILQITAHSNSNLFSSIDLKIVIF